MRLLDEADDLELLGAGEPHASSPPSAIMLFLSKPQLERLLGNDFLQLLGLALEVLDLVAGRGAGGVAGESPLAGLQELFRPAVVEALGNAFAAAQLGDRRRHRCLARSSGALSSDRTCAA